MNSREQLAKDNGMTIEFVNWFFDNKKDGCGTVWFMMMAAMWEGWNGREANCTALAAENAGLKSLIEQHADSVAVCPNCSHEEPSATDDIVELYRSMETPATDSFRAEVRAQGVEMFAKYIALYNSNSEQHAHSFAAQLRNGAGQ